MKTPTQRLEGIILERRDQAIRNLQNYPSRSDIYETKIFFCDDILEIIDYLIQEEKDWIIGAYHFGWDDGANNYRPVSDVIYEDGEDFYNKKFNQ